MAKKNSTSTLTAKKDKLQHPRCQFGIDVVVSYLQDESNPEEASYVFGYTITIQNTGKVAAQLVARHWVIEDATGLVQNVDGLGVVGNQPFLQPDQSFEYNSGCQISTPSGSMHGHYFCVSEDGERFEVPIALFILEANVPHARVLH